jgi:L-malate glycosyltransferase
MVTLHVDLGKQWRGGQAQALLLMKGLRTRGHGAELVARRASPLALRAEAEGIRVHPVAPPGLRLRAARMISRLMAEQKVEIVHTHEAHALTAAWLARASRGTGLVASRRLAYRLKQNAISLARYRSVARLVAVSRFVAESLLASSVEKQRVVVVYDGVEIPPAATPEERARARQRWGVAADEPLLGCVGYLLPEKGQELLIRAWPEVRAKVRLCSLLLAGDGPLRPRFEGLAQELEVSDSVHFAGFVEKISEVYAALDVFLFPSLAEPLGSSLLAALASGLPTVALGRGAVPEVITNGENGVLVEAPDAAAFASAVLRVVKDPALAARLGAAARRTIEQHFSSDRMVDETLRVYGQVSEERSADVRTVA